MTGYPDYVAPIYDVNSRGIQNPSVYRATSYFPQPQGSIYMINASSDVANVPVGSGISAAICMGEGVLHLKTVQNGSPAIVSYRISPLGVADNQAQAQNSAPAASQAPAQTPAPESKILEAFDPSDRIVWGAYKVKGRA